MAEYIEQCRKCFHYQVCAPALKYDLLIREVLCDEKPPKCKMFVEVVRCKDCKFYGWEQEPCHGKTVHYCKLDAGLVIARKDTFCSYGERK